MPKLMIIFLREIPKVLNVKPLIYLTNREVPATIVRSCVQIFPGKIGEARYAGYTHGKEVQRSSKD